MHGISSTAEIKPRPLIPPITAEELARRNAAAIALLDAWAEDVESEQDQRETVEVLRQALGVDRIAADRSRARRARQ